MTATISNESAASIIPVFPSSIVTFLNEFRSDTVQTQNCIQAIISYQKANYTQTEIAERVQKQYGLDAATFKIYFENTDEGLLFTYAAFFESKMRFDYQAKVSTRDKRISLGQRNIFFGGLGIVFALFTGNPFAIFLPFLWLIVGVIILIVGFSTAKPTETTAQIISVIVQNLLIQGHNESNIRFWLARSRQFADENAISKFLKAAKNVFRERYNSKFMHLLGVGFAFLLLGCILVTIEPWIGSIFIGIAIWRFYQSSQLTQVIK